MTRLIRAVILVAKIQLVDIPRQIVGHMYHHGGQRGHVPLWAQNVLEVRAYTCNGLATLGQHATLHIRLFGVELRVL